MRAAAASRSQPFVLCSMSVNRKVTVPAGNWGIPHLRECWSDPGLQWGVLPSPGHLFPPGLPPRAVCRERDTVETRQMHVEHEDVPGFIAGHAKPSGSVVA